jgi:hypothetical protein
LSKLFRVWRICHKHIVAYIYLWTSLQNRISSCCFLLLGKIGSNNHIQAIWYNLHKEDNKFYMKVAVLQWFFSFLYLNAVCVWTVDTLYPLVHAVQCSTFEWRLQWCVILPSLLKSWEFSIVGPCCQVQCISILNLSVSINHIWAPVFCFSKETGIWRSDCIC